MAVALPEKAVGQLSQLCRAAAHQFVRLYSLRLLLAPVPVADLHHTRSCTKLKSDACAVQLDE